MLTLQTVHHMAAWDSGIDCSFMALDFGHAWGLLEDAMLDRVICYESPI
jgi:hypothetical protein